MALGGALFAWGLLLAVVAVAADGWTGRAVAAGKTRDSTIRGWQAMVAQLRPFPEKPKEPPEPLPEPAIDQSFDGEQFSFHGVLRGPSSDVPWVEPTVENSPAAVLPLAGAPPSAPPLGTWTYLVDAYGTVRPAAVRRHRGGFTLVGDRLLEVVDPAALDALLDAADRDFDARPFPEFERPPGFPEPPPADCGVRTYRFVDEKSRAPVKPAVASAGRRMGFDARGLDGEHLRWQVVRVRHDRA